MLRTTIHREDRVHIVYMYMNVCHQVSPDKEKYFINSHAFP